MLAIEPRALKLEGSTFGITPSIYVLKSLMVLFSPVWSCMVPYGPVCPVWYHMVPYGTVKNRIVLCPKFVLVLEPRALKLTFWNKALYLCPKEVL